MILKNLKHIAAWMLLGLLLGAVMAMVMEMEMSGAILGGGAAGILYGIISLWKARGEDREMP